LGGYCFVVGVRRALSLMLGFSTVAVALLASSDAALAQCNPIGADQTCTNSTLLSGGADGRPAWLVLTRRVLFLALEFNLSAE